MVSVKGKQIRYLTDIGFTKNQAMMYLTLLKLESANAHSISKRLDLPRTEIYRTLEELMRKGLVEKEITTPAQFRAVPLDLGLQMLIDRQVMKCRDLTEKTKEFLREFQNSKNEKSYNQEYKLIKIEGRRRLLQVMKLQHANAQQEVDVLTTLPRWIQILNCCFEDYKEALDRGVKYRVVLEVLNSELKNCESAKELLKKKNFDMRLSQSMLRTNAAIFDQKEVTVNLVPSTPLAGSSLIWTNHPSFILMCQDHFEAVWKTANKCKLSDTM